MTVTVPVSRRVPAPAGDAWIRKTVTGALKGAGVRSTKEVGVVFVGDGEMTKLNTAYRGKRKTTDVLAFPNAPQGTVPVRGPSPRDLGDLVISVPQARRQAAAAKKPLKKELALLLVHGTLHLLGYDHETAKDEKRMFSLQARILKRPRYA